MPLVSPRTMCETIFGLPYPPNKEDLITQHRKLVKLLHPDKGGDKNEFIRMQDAFNVLKPIAIRQTSNQTGISTIQGILLEELGNGHTPSMPKCTECSGLGYLRNQLQVLQSYRTCPTCLGMPTFRCPQCQDRGTIKKVSTLRMDVICKPCHGTGQIYQSNPVLRVNSL